MYMPRESNARNQSCRRRRVFDFFSLLILVSHCYRPVKTSGELIEPNPVGGHSGFWASTGAMRRRSRRPAWPMLASRVFRSAAGAGDQLEASSGPASTCRRCAFRVGFQALVEPGHPGRCTSCILGRRPPRQRAEPAPTILASAQGHGSGDAVERLEGRRPRRRRKPVIRLSEEKSARTRAGGCERAQPPLR